jgi:hypothetical protein
MPVKKVSIRVMDGPSNRDVARLCATCAATRQRNRAVEDLGNVSGRLRLSAPEITALITL